MTQRSTPQPPSPARANGAISRPTASRGGVGRGEGLSLESPRRSLSVRCSILLCFLIIIPSCTNQPQRPLPDEETTSGKPAPTPAISNTDPCAMRLHDISGALLFYYAARHKLPDDLADLKKTPLGIDLEFTCPESNQPYIYNRAGVPAPDGENLLIVYDATPVHKDFRLAISVPATNPEGALVTKVIPIPEAHFSRAP